MISCLFFFVQHLLQLSSVRLCVRVWAGRGWLMWSRWSNCMTQQHFLPFFLFMSNMFHICFQFSLGKKKMRGTLCNSLRGTGEGCAVRGWSHHQGAWSECEQRCYLGDRLWLRIYCPITFDDDITAALRAVSKHSAGISPHHHTRTERRAAPFSPGGLGLTAAGLAYNPCDSRNWNECVRYWHPPVYKEAGMCTKSYSGCSF